MDEQPRTSKQTACDDARLTARENRTFGHWIAASTRLRKIERELDAARADERRAWRDYARSAHGDAHMTWSDRVADAISQLWSEPRASDPT